MLIYIDHQMRDHPPVTYEDLIENIRHGAVQRVRPKLMTVSVIILGLIPIFLTEGPGSDVMRRIALPMVGGMVSTTILTLILIPVLYAVMLAFMLKMYPDKKRMPPLLCLASSYSPGRCGWYAVRKRSVI
jgi:Cu(I)/Ag(I) efflux system membrane protein CusA/SilA